MDIEIDMECPECGASFTATLAEVAQGASKHCPNGHPIKLEDDGGGAREVQRSLDDLDDSLSQLEK
jgi:hypothetical protein